MKKISSKKWILITAIFLGICIMLPALLNIIVDPFFHYHKPISCLSYPLSGDKERYLNDGILRNFDYDSIITGTSITENFKTSEFDEIFNAHSVKTCLAGASFYETNNQLIRACNYNPDIKYVLRAIDVSMFTQDKDTERTDLGTYPYYLYDNNIFNDVKYVLNKDIIFESISVLTYSLNHNPQPTMDDYANWNNSSSYGKEVVLSTYTKPEYVSEQQPLSDEEREREIANIEQNVIQIAKDNPDITFYLFIPPNSICWWESEVISQGRLDAEIEIQKIAIEKMLECDNIKLYSFFQNYDLICNLDYYKDVLHYNEGVNSDILYWIKNDEYLITKDNYQQYLSDIRSFYGSYDYDNIYVSAQ